MRTTTLFLALSALALALTTQAQDVSQNGKCGADKSLTCKESDFGECCSQWGYCGSGDRYCGTGCDPNFGTCNDFPETPSSTIAAPAPSSSNARCGFMNGAEGGQSCMGSKDGDCCSQWSYCGRTDKYCGGGCQSDFGTCS